MQWLETPPPGCAMKKLYAVSNHDESVLAKLVAQVESLFSEIDAVICESK